MKSIPLVLLLCGCHLVMGFDELVAPEVDGPSAPDAALADATPDPPPDAACTTLGTWTVSSDTSILPGSCPGGANRTGKSTNVNVGQGGTSRVLLDFDVANALSTLAAASHGVLSLGLRPNDCDCTNAPTAFEVYPVVPTWNEGDGSSYHGADWCSRDGTGETQQTPWGAPGAEGAADRSQVALTTFIAGPAEVGAPWRIDVPFVIDGPRRAAMTTFASAGSISVILIPTSGGTLFLASREYMMGASAATLTLRSCP